MIKTLLFLIYFLYCYNIFGQQPTRQTAEQQSRLQQKPAAIIKEELLTNQNRPFQQVPRLIPVTKRVTKASRPSFKITAAYKKHIQSIISQRPAFTGCPDTTIRKLFNAKGLQEIVYCSYAAMNGDVLIGGVSRDTSLGYAYFGHLLRVNSKGKILWAKQYNDINIATISVLFIKELADGSIFISGDYLKAGVNGNNPFPTMMISKLRSTGDIIWSKTYQSVLSTCNYVPVRITAIAEGINNEILFGASLSNCPYPQFQVVGKLSSQGSLLWDKSIKQWNNFEYVEGIFFVAGKVVVAGRSGGIQSGGDDVIDIHFTELNYADGALLRNKAWKPNVTSSASYPAFKQSFVMYAVYAEVLNNGHYLIYGKLFDSFDDFTPRDTIHHFAVLEFDKDYDFIKGYTIYSSLLSRYYINQISANKDGKVSYMLYRPEGNSANHHYFGVAENNQVVKQRKIYYPENDYSGVNQLPILKDGSYGFVETVLTNNGYSTSVEFTKLHNSDTTNSACTGVDTSFANTSPLQYVPYENFRIDSISSNKMYETASKLLAAPFNYQANDVCEQVALCDTIKIRGRDTICSINQLYTYTAYRAKTCGAKVRWKIDTSKVSVFNQINDTTVSIRFKGNFNSFVYGEFDGRCGTVKDSFHIIVSQPTAGLNLGPDTTVCVGNTLQLVATAGYLSYLWQDNSSLTTFKVTSPGKYYVTTNDACGNVYSDTVFVGAQPYIPFNASPDTSKCNSDTIVLSAPPGFVNYTWSPGYNITNPTASIVKVFPAVDTFYIVKAEKSPGCFVVDTVKVKVNISPLINLGADTSFCAGDSIVAYAGNGSNRYTWSTGSTLPRITIRSPGTYAVIATTADGCYAADTLVVPQLFSPAVSLGNNFNLCTGDSKNLDAGSFTGYTWQDGSVNRRYSVAQPGAYWVTVTDIHHCSASDTVYVTSLLPLPKNFLQPTDSLCEYSKIPLHSIGTFKTYLWSTGSAQPSIEIDKPGVFTLSVSDANGCKGSDTIRVIAKDCLKGVYIPTAFTPNNDGSNDVFRVMVYETITSFQLNIYNRFGQLVFSNKDPLKGWDGTVNSTPQNPGTFAYQCVYQLQGSKQIMEKGTVLLIR